LTLISTLGAAICFGVTATYDIVRQNDPSVTASWVPLTFLLSSAFLTHMGIRLLPWILIGTSRICMCSPIILTISNR
jgi:hypothetical protein